MLTLAADQGREFLNRCFPNNHVRAMQEVLMELPADSSEIEVPQAFVFFYLWNNAILYWKPCHVQVSGPVEPSMNSY